MKYLKNKQPYCRPAVVKNKLFSGHGKKKKMCGDWRWVKNNDVPRQELRDIMSDIWNG